LADEVCGKAWYGNTENNEWGHTKFNRVTHCAIPSCSTDNRR
jgi:hypothetical protein